MDKVPPQQRVDCMSARFTAMHIAIVIIDLFKLIAPSPLVESSQIVLEREKFPSMAAAR